MSPVISPSLAAPEVATAHFELGDVLLTSGSVLPDARLAYATHGRLNEAGDNCILMPTYYTGTHRSYEPIIGPGHALDPERWFIVIPNMFGNGESTSPSHGLGADFPQVSILDNVRCQRRLLIEKLGVRRIALATGWSLGAVQSLHWAATYPSSVRAVLAVCGTASCWPLNRVFLEGVKAALTADADFQGGRYVHPPLKGLRAFGRAYAGWAYSAAFFREGLYRQLGAKSIDAFLRAWELEHEVWDANDLLAMLATWAEADIGSAIGGEAHVALREITARTVLMPGAHDAYFTLEEAAMEASSIPNAELRPLLSPYGHCAGAPGRFAEETSLIEQAMSMVLAASE
ncbi:alpha/beta fold hydrolase [Xanthobacter wiegelii]|uniref:alpha/beta fold hydrolase n=1 Tax=Xanthobacter wiegelii TaxID=3119913 RepID=UPI00372CBFE0